MDPGYYEATKRFKRPKPRLTKPRNSLERQIRSNPYAQALATPVRFCVLTQARLPSYFVQDFDLVRHPETDAPWYVPSMEDMAPASDGSTSSGNSRGSHNISQSSEPEVGSQTRIERSQGPTASRLQTHVLANRFLLRSLVGSSPTNRKKSTPLFNLARSAEAKKLGSQAIWREDMETFLLDQMRRNVVNQLLYLARLCKDQGRKYIASYGSWGQLSFEEHRTGCVLWFGPPVVGQDTMAISEPATKSSQFAVLQRADPKEQVPVYDMTRLLGQDCTEKLRQGSDIFGGNNTFILSRGRTTRVQLQLWKIQGYMSDRGFSEKDSKAHVVRTT